MTWVGDPDVFKNNVFDRVTGYASDHDRPGFRLLVIRKSRRRIDFEISIQSFSSLRPILDDDLGNQVVDLNVFSMRLPGHFLALRRKCCLDCPDA